MTEYVDKALIGNMLTAITDDEELIINALDSLPAAYVVDKEKINDAVEEIHSYEHENGEMFNKGMMKALGIFMRHIEEI